MRTFFIGCFTLFATTASAQWEQVADRNMFNTSVVGRSYVDERGNWFQFNSNGTLNGGAQGKDLVGTWQFRGGMACFNRTLAGEALPNDCIVVLIDGSNLVTVRDRGRGRQTQYRMQ